MYIYERCEGSVKETHLIQVDKGELITGHVTQVDFGHKH